MSKFKATSKLKWGREYFKFQREFRYHIASKFTLKLIFLIANVKFEANVIAMNILLISKSFLLTVGEICLQIL